MIQIIPFGFEKEAIGIRLFAMGTALILVTIPLEQDASNRALAWLKRKNSIPIRIRWSSRCTKVGC